MWHLDDEKRKLGQHRALDWSQVGPLGQRVSRIFANLVYQDYSSPLPLTVWCSPEWIIILADTHPLGSDEVDITVDDNALLLTIKNMTGGVSTQVENKSQPYSISLPCAVDVEHIEAGLEDNLLHIKLPCLSGNTQDHPKQSYIQ